MYSQEITRANKGWALDRMVLCNEVTKWMKDDINQPPTEGVYVYGLYLEGAGWDRRNCKLIDSKPKVLFEMMPVIRMYAENNGELYYLGTVWRGNKKKSFGGAALYPTCLLNVCIPHSHSLDVTFKCQAE